MKDIRQLVEKYFDGTTTVAEEQQLRDFFIQDALILPEDLKPLKDLFAWEKQQKIVSELSSNSVIEKSSKQQRSKLSQKIIMLISIAAIFMVVVLMIRQVKLGQYNDYGVINGERTTNKEILHREAEAALDIVSNDGDKDFDALLLIGENSNEK